MKIVGLLFTGLITTVVVLIFGVLLFPRDAEQSARTMTTITIIIAAITVSAFIGYRIGDHETRITPWRAAGIAALSAIATLGLVLLLIVKYLP